MRMIRQVRSSRLRVFNGFTVENVVVCFFDTREGREREGEREIETVEYE